jgi:Fe-S-cluster-containing dehydrogenase component
MSTVDADSPDGLPDEAGGPPRDTFGRRQFVEELLKVCAAGTPVLLGVLKLSATELSGAADGYDPGAHYYGMGIDVDKCIGCARCVVACKAENDVPADAHHFNTWVERYVVRTSGAVQVDSPNGGLSGFRRSRMKDLSCARFRAQALQPLRESTVRAGLSVGATFSTRDGVVLVDEDYCLGCRYCIQACPYGRAGSTAEEGRREVHLVLPPGSARPGAGVRRGVSDRCARVR